MKKLFLLLAVFAAIFMIAVSPVAAEIGSITDQSIHGNGNTQISASGGINVKTANIKIGTYAPISSSDYSTNIVQYYTEESNGYYDLDTGVIGSDRVLMHDEVLALPIPKFGNNATTVYIVTGTPVAVYTIGTGTLVNSGVQPSDSKLYYDAIYGRMEHGSVTPVDAVPYYTNKCSLTISSGSTYLIIDNRYYPEDAAADIEFYDSGVSLANVPPQNPVVYGISD